MNILKIAHIALPAVMIISLAGGVSAQSMMTTSTMNSDTSMMNDTVSLQSFLETHGFLTMPIGSTKGHFGPLTRRALMKYQASVGLNAAGYYGALTRAKIAASMSMMVGSNTSGTVNSGSTSISADTSAGVMVGGALMTRDLDIVDNAIHAGNVTTVVAAVKAAGLVATLKSAGPFTVFAPTNSAFAKLPAGTVETLVKPENKATLTDILTYHVVAGKYRMSDLTDGLMLKTVEGKMLKFTRVNGTLMINGSAMIETPDVISSNGVTHVIDTVLMPQ